MPKNVTFYFNSTLLHFTQLITGLEILKQKGEINLKYTLENKNYPIDICRIMLQDKILIFDLADNSAIRESIYRECDFYIKRMLLKKDFEQKNKLIPYGLNYPVFFENEYMQNLVYNRNYFKYGIRYNKTISRLFNIKNSISTSHLRDFKAQSTEKSKIIFRTRLWNPDNNSIIWKKKERVKMNQERIEINIVMRDKFGDLFEGGIEDDEFSKGQCGDLLLSPKDYHKKNYLKLLKNAAIGIVNPGLEDSIGWKFGEYVAHGVVVLTTPVEHYMFRGNFKEGENYLSYSSISDLLKKTELLYQDDIYLQEIVNRNIQYYKYWLEPSAKLRSIFNEIGFE